MNHLSFLELVDKDIQINGPVWQRMRWHDVAAVRKLLDEGLDPETTARTSLYMSKPEPPHLVTKVVNVQGRTLLAAAALAGSAEIVQMLLQAGARVERQVLPCARPARRRLCGASHTLAARPHRVTKARLRCALQGPNNETALHFAYNPQVATALLTHEPSKIPLLLSLKTTKGDVPLHTATFPFKYMESLLPTHPAIKKFDSPAVVAVLLAAGANPEARNDSGVTVRRMAEDELACCLFCAFFCWFGCIPCGIKTVSDMNQIIDILDDAHKQRSEAARAALASAAAAAGVTAAPAQQVATPRASN